MSPLRSELPRFTNLSNYNLILLFIFHIVSASTDRIFPYDLLWSSFSYRQSVPDFPTQDSDSVTVNFAEWSDSNILECRLLSTKFDKCVNGRVRRSAGVFVLHHGNIVRLIIRFFYTKVCIVTTLPILISCNISFLTPILKIFFP
jgi:hypothetical protein